MASAKEQARTENHYDYLNDERKDKRLDDPLERRRLWAGREVVQGRRGDEAGQQIIQKFDDRRARKVHAPEAMVAQIQDHRACEGRGDLLAILRRMIVHPHDRVHVVAPLPDSDQLDALGSLFDWCGWSLM